MNLDEFLGNRRKRLLDLAGERISGESPTMLAMPLGAEFGREVRREDLERIRRMRTKVVEDDIAFDPTFDSYKAWLYMFGVPYSAGPAKTVTMKSLPQFKNRNEDWDTILNGLNRVGRPSGEGEFLRPVGPWVYDLTREPHGYRLLEAAHVLAHARALAARKTVQDMRYRGFLETLSELVIARRYRMTVKVPTEEEIVSGRRSGGLSMFEDCGVRPVVSTNLRKPWLVAGMQNGCITLFRDSIAVLVGIHLEPQPWSAREDNPNSEDESWLEMNRWSCMPSIVSISGWIGVDELSKAPVVSRTAGQDISTGSFAMPVTALDGPSSLDCLLCKAIMPEDPENGIVQVDSFMEGDWLQRLKRIVAPLPCRECLRLNLSAEGAPTRPAHRRPNPSDRRPNPEAVKEWAEYDAKIDKIFEIVRKASDFFFCRFDKGGRKVLKERRKNAKFVSDALSRIASNERRARSANAKGFSDRAAKLKERSKELIDGIGTILKGATK